uniref:Uncharacterized protein n=1 Tax=Ixodes ricinus TaxID=34613 RepID=A0A6B0U6N7_IXORI
MPVPGAVLGLSDLRPVFLIWCFGMTLSVLVLFSELNFFRSVWRWCRKTMSSLYSKIPLLYRAFQKEDVKSDGQGRIFAT